jgi:hypothetical protein
MKKLAALLIVCLTVYPLSSRNCLAAAVSGSEFLSLVREFYRDFQYVDAVHTIETHGNDSRFDLIVVGSDVAEKSGGLKVEVLSMEHHNSKKIWSFAISKNDNEFLQSGPQNVDIQGKDSDYKITIEGCATHECYDGTFGFLVYYRQTGKAFRAKVVAKGLSGSEAASAPPTYDVSYSAGMTDEAKNALQMLICNNAGISNKAGLPFSCR